MEMAPIRLPKTDRAPESPAHDISNAKFEPKSEPRLGQKSGLSRILWLTATAAIVGGAWFFISPLTQSPGERVPRAEEIIKSPAATAVPEKGESMPAAEMSAAAAETRRTTEVPPQATGSNAPVASAAPSPTLDDLIVVTVKTLPEDARFFYKGKPVGRSPFRVELKRGQRRAFEIGRPGFLARKVVVDGTKLDMTVAMRPEGPAATPASK